jgi:hypothetical protein
VPEIAVDFQEGFENDEIVLYVNGKEALHLPSVSTSKLTGVASSHRIEVSTDSVELHLSLLTRKADTTVALRIEKARFVGFSLVDGAIHCITSEKPYMYM